MSQERNNRENLILTPSELTLKKKNFASKDLSTMIEAFGEYYSEKLRECLKQSKYSLAIDIKNRDFGYQ